MQSMGFIALVSLTFCLTGSTGGQSESTPAVSPKAEVTVLARRTSHVGEMFLLTLRIENVGKTPFYIAPAVESVGDYRGGFEVVITPPAGARMQGGGRSGATAPVDILKEAKNFILLKPGETYGGNLLSAVVTVPGTYRVVGRHRPLLLSDADKDKLRAELRFPMLFEVVESKPIFLRVAKQSP